MSVGGVLSVRGAPLQNAEGRGSITGANLASGGSHWFLARSAHFQIGESISRDFQMRHQDVVGEKGTGDTEQQEGVWVGVVDVQRSGRVDRCRLE